MFLIFIVVFLKKKKMRENRKEKDYSRNFNVSIYNRFANIAKIVREQNLLVLHYGP